MEAAKQTILVVDDDENDRFFIEHALQKTTLSLVVKMVNDGEEAIAYLQGEGKFSDRNLFPQPNLIFLDLKMPRVTGFELLEWLKSHEAFGRIPAVVISSSNAQEDIDRAYDLGANVYLIKPVSPEQFRKLFEATGEFFVARAAKPSVKAKT